MTEPVAGTRSPVADASIERGTPAASARSRPGRTPNPSAARGPRVVFVIVNWRSAADTIRCLESFAQLDWPNPEFLVVENDSRDGSATKLIEATADRPDVRLIIAPSNLGFTGGNNLGIRRALARGADFVVLVNPDTTLVNPGFVRACVERLEREPSLGAVGPMVYLREAGKVQNTILEFPWLHRRIANVALSWFGRRRARSGETERPAEVLNGVCLVLRRQALEAVEGFDPLIFAYVDEADLFLRLRRAGFEARYLPTPSVIHHQRADGYGRGSRVEYLLKRNTLYFLRKHGRWIQAAAYSATVLMSALLMLLARRLVGRPPGITTGYCRQLTAAFTGLWLGRTDRVMGPPRLD
jgi:hypothetical protein